MRTNPLSNQGFVLFVFGVVCGCVQESPNILFRELGNAGDLDQDLSHSRQALYIPALSLQPTQTGAY